MNLIRSSGSILLGFIVVVVLSIATDLVMHATGIMPSGVALFDTKLVLLALAYRTVYTIVGGYVTAKTAPHHPMRHAIILGCIGMVVGSLGAIANADLGPLWYSWGLVVESLPCMWIGAKLAK